MRITDFDDIQVARMRGPLPFDEFASDGCTKSPEMVRGEDGGMVSVSLACVFHDCAYSIGKSESHRRQTDLDFVANMLILQAQWPVAWSYYRAVRVLGAFSRGRVSHRACE